MKNFTFRETSLYEKAFKQAMGIFEMTKLFPPEERYSLIDQIRRSSRSVCANYAEAFRKQKYPKYYKSKLSDCDMENGETLVWLDIALASNYISKEQYLEKTRLNSEVGNLIGYALKTIRNPK
jgi:four helix bundle protein